MNSPFRCGFVAIVGRPNVGKSTLMNRLIGQKISITSRKPQTTRHRVTGIYTDEQAQLVFVDTPGFQTEHGGALNNALNDSVRQTLSSVDVVLFVIEAAYFGARDEAVLRLLPKERPVYLVLNKLDAVGDRERMIPFLQDMATRFDFAGIIPVSARKGTQVDALIEAVRKHLPEGPALYDEDQITDRSERFLAAEIVREKLFRLLGDELPYGLAVEIEKFELDGRLRRVSAAVLVDRESHKAMVIGKGGEKLKRVGTEARQDMEKLFDGKVFLEVWVKVKSGWADDVRVLRELGLE